MASACGVNQSSVAVPFEDQGMDVDFYEECHEDKSQKVWLNRIFAQPFSEAQDGPLSNANLQQPATLPTRTWYKMPEGDYEYKADLSDTSGACSASSSSECESSDSESDSDDYTSDEDNGQAMSTSSSPAHFNGPAPAPQMIYDGEINDQIPSTIFDLINNNLHPSEGQQ